MAEMMECKCGDRSAIERRYKGVRLRNLGNWVSEIRLPNNRERIWLGSYDSPEKDTRAFDTAASAPSSTSPTPLRPLSPASPDP
ncbi:ethylene-responsive transcription factor [Canna indica]|uniref:Ethylene-responsive transcription factor n=1 Tax=Canna indica TaxID=4628 RepID=A0AAQ3QTN8_9LILI|nr:ethylene-responsive transcription factor [Canna indica]